jgi:hypothetical protein
MDDRDDRAADPDERDPDEHTDDRAGAAHDGPNADLPDGQPGEVGAPPDLEGLEPTRIDPEESASPG